MPRLVNGNSYLTLEEAAHELGVSSRTLRTWIDKNVVTKPPELEHGLRTFYAFTPEWVGVARKEIAARRKRQGSKTKK